MKLRYFAWVRERVGKAEEDVEVPGGIVTVGDLMTWLASRGEEYAYAFANRGHRQDPRQAAGRDRKRFGNRIFPANDGRIAPQALAG